MRRRGLRRMIAREFNALHRVIKIFRESRIQALVDKPWEAQCVGVGYYPFLEPYSNVFS